jgi:alpha-1,6-mannosyltransferase
LVKIPLGVDLDIFHPAHRSEEVRNKLLKGGEVLIIHCGRLSPEKKPQRSIDALRHLHERGINARLVFIGHGPLYSKLYKSTRDIPVTFWGYVANRKLLATMLASADLTIAPGPLETFCLAALESLASGTPVVASNTSAVGEFLFSNTPHTVGAIAENNGLSFAEEIEKLILRMKTDPEIRSRCHQVALKYPWAKTANLLNQLPINPELKVA